MCTGRGEEIDPADQSTKCKASELAQHTNAEKEIKNVFITISLTIKNQSFLLEVYQIIWLSLNPSYWVIGPAQNPDWELSSNVVLKF